MLQSIQTQKIGRVCIMIHQILPQRIYHYNYSDNETLKNFETEEKEYDLGDSRPTNEKDVKFTRTLFSPDEYPKSFVFTLNDVPRDFAKFLGSSFRSFLHSEKIVCNDYNFDLCWLNIHDKEQNKHVKHTHSNSMFSAVYYVQCINNDCIEFYSSNLFSDYHLIAREDDTIYAEDVHRLKVNEGDLIIFRSDIPHGVPQFTGKRITLAFNINLTGIGTNKVLSRKN